ncbi:ABC transporter ATP-binding protein [Lacisediminimonas sp.]|uniref:ABC transporter ATP-binding protein n=1 Tax=Lacisediminimonas sp. TaxID=3060582 RepID=UPI00272136EE|nr:ABC transporter ATP-binding protein [Lacisediminimonas sp.]MDO8300844.1 ABC transporter ATP-binding protein [Lacisediminimonas sp.]
MSAPLLQLSDLRVSYGGIEAVKGIDLVVHPGELVTLIGANGAGKTSTLSAITNTLAQARVEGQVLYQGEPLARVPSFALVKRGLAMVPEGRGVFTRMTIKENLLMGAHSRSDHDGIGKDLEQWLEIFPRLSERLHQLAGTLSGGEQQMLAMARALMSRPRLLLLDEPSMGLAPIMVRRIFDVVRQVSAQGVTILLVEQNALQALEAADRAYVMESGLLTMSGKAADRLHDPGVRRAYLGES